MMRLVIILIALLLISLPAY
ncbi:TPA: type I toxin-antitoxin system Ibs family toxin [Escherichia coli]|nr:MULTISPECIES: type I toxin-antitoxin system Ibs family toxin [Escherichia]HAL9675826.1 type I toxin-antitoxin system Ibs family toxin [Escherichia coli]EFL4479095.1 type I toxin-antitoxin system Ibs family toxin [Escherichia fergusonii]MBY7353544.1 type I toxin-antitoxin system Ibs family toxin [Escherichia ruysiae]MBY7447918.1 type I toxin-antitoxin system Ibs family toxin [Escherichia fergusonii]MBY7557803.1 type I toxin-antitoxin system Ibs family toxin [Escherichia fergusonii]